MFRRPRFGPTPLPCNHRYCYRYSVCTKCGKRYAGPGEPYFTPHIVVNDKLVPAKTGPDGNLVPE